MKRIILALLMIFTLVFSASAGTIVADGWSYSTDTINNNGSIYVPIRFVAEKLGYAVEWRNNTVIIKGKQQLPDTSIPDIIGDEYFQAAVKTALDKLALEDRLDYLLICQYVPAIQEMDQMDIKKDGYDIAATTDNLTRVTCVNKEFVSDARCTAPVLAGLLVHEATHAAYFEFGCMDEKELERQAYNREISALTLLGADADYIRETQAVMKAFIE